MDAELYEVEVAAKVFLDAILSAHELGSGSFEVILPFSVQDLGDQWSIFADGMVIRRLPVAVQLQ